MRRRDFLHALGSASLAAALTPRPAFTARATAVTHFGVHPLIENSPDAVFIMRTNITDKHDEAGKRRAGLDLASSVFVPKEAGPGAFPIGNKIVIKPNLTSRGNWMKEYTIERSMGVATDVFFVEGLIDGLKTGLGKNGSDFYLREVNGDDNLTDGGYAAMAARTGVDIKIIKTQAAALSPDKVVWKDVPNGVWFNKIPYLWPVNAPDTFLLNVSKLKSHGMGMTLCAKNLQGTIAASYQQHCTAFNAEMSIDYKHVQANAKQVIQANYNRHRNVIPRWDRPGQTGGLWQETWGSRCLDNNSVTKPALHIIEGIYGHDGNFVQGPHNGYAEDFMMNYLIFGKNAYHVDVIGTWLSGHEPGNFGLFHLAMERGLSTQLNPYNIPLYEWSADGSASAVMLDNFARTPLKTYYLLRDYNGQNEDYWHLVNEPYDYGTTDMARRQFTQPASFELEQNYPNPFNGGTTIEYHLPQPGYVQLDIYNSTGQRVEKLVAGLQTAGQHVVTWRPVNKPSGVYLYRCQFNGAAKTGRMLLVQ